MFFFIFEFTKKIFVFTGKYYLVDSGYPNEYGFLGPYRGQRYHLQEFRRRGQPQTREEIFNRVHSSLCCVIERTFGVWKKRWWILQNMTSCNYKAQVQIVVASMAIHNYIRAPFVCWKVVSFWKVNSGKVNYFLMFGSVMENKLENNFQCLVMSWKMSWKITY